MLLPLAVATLIGYLMGSLPFGYLVARAKGVNIFEVGSKNPGATNVRRVLGAGPGNLVFALDVLKGALAASWALLSQTAVSLEVPQLGSLAGGTIDSSDWVSLGVAGLIAALMGHSFSCFTKFRGGKGVATSMGGLIVLMPVVTLIAGVAWLAVFLMSRYVSLASIAAAIVLVLAAYLMKSGTLLVGLSTVVAAFVILRHRSNIGRLLNGTENRFVKKTPATKP